MQCLNSGWSKSKTVKAVYEKGYDGSKNNAFDYLIKIEERKCKTFEPQEYIRTRNEALKYKAGSTGKQENYITREGVFKHMWMNMDLTEFQRAYIIINLRIYGKSTVVLKSSEIFFKIERWFFFIYS